MKGRCVGVWAFGRIGVGGALLATPREPLRPPSKDFDQDDDSVQRKRRIPRTIKSTGEDRMAEPVDNWVINPIISLLSLLTSVQTLFCFLLSEDSNLIWRLHLKLLFWPVTVLGPK
jgi:hypothetical protein